MKTPLFILLLLMLPLLLRGQLDKEIVDYLTEANKVPKYYTRSVEINPDNQHGVDKIKQFKKQLYHEKIS